MGSPTQEFASKGVAGTALGLLNGGNCGYGLQYGLKNT